MLPLDDLLILDLSRVLSGPYCSMFLADFGARIIKVERPGEGDDTRALGPPFAGGESAYFLSINRNKESIALDLKHPEGRAIVQRLAGRADVLLENFRPGILERLGLGYEALREINPRLVYTSISGYGHAGLPAYRELAGFDLVMQGIGGVSSLTGDPDRPPVKCGVSIADMVSGLYALLGTLVALHARARTGRGQHVDVSMLDGQISLLTYHATGFFMTGRAPRRMGNRHPSLTPYDTYEAQDGYLNIGVANDAHWRKFAADILEQPALAADPRFATVADRVGLRERLDEIIAPLLARRPMDHWLSRLDAAGIPCGPVYTVPQALAHPQVLARGMVTSVEHPTAGKVQMTGVPVRLSETAGAVRTPPPRLGEHTRSVLGDLLGLDSAEITSLAARGVIAEAP